MLLLIIASITFLVIALFYWYEWRPSQIRAECAEYTKEKVKGKNVRAEEVELVYELCLHTHGSN